MRKQNSIRQFSSRIFQTILILLALKAETVHNFDNAFQHMLVRLNNDREVEPHEGRVEVSYDNATWGTICSTQWSLREGNVVCRQLNLGYAAMVNQSTEFGNSEEHPWALLGTLCRGTEGKLSHCFRETTYPSAACNDQNKNVAVVRCVSESPDLRLGLREIEESAYLDAVPMSKLTCAMEENCLSRDAYIQPIDPDAVRLLLRFTTLAENTGTVAFSPYMNYDQWKWHQCHRHYHSMESFATFDIYDLKYNKIAEGHKASFCLMDSVCVGGIEPLFSCGNYTQGISIGCADVYTPDLDCQWVDVTKLPIDKTYILRVALNNEYKIGETSFENNGAECLLKYTGQRNTTTITQCMQAPLWFKY